jgi:hypothetical protein
MSVTLHTNLGDIKLEVFCESVPKTAEVRFRRFDDNKPDCSRIFLLSVHPIITMDLFFIDSYLSS